MHLSKKRRGRPRQNRLKVDKGTKELQQKRGILLGTDHEQNHALAESLLGLFYGRQLISQSLYEAGVFFGELGYRYEPCLGQKFRQNSSSLFSKTINSQGCSPLLWSDEQDEKRTIAWCKALKALKQAGQEPYKIVLDVVFYNQDLYRMSFPSDMNIFVKPLRKGLESLAIYFRGGSQGVQGKHCDRGLNPERSTRLQLLLNERRSYSPP